MRAAIARFDAAVDRAVDRVRSPARRRRRVPAVERGRSQPALARVRRARPRSRAAATSGSRPGSRRAMGAESLLTNGAVKIAVPAGAARPSTPTSSSTTACTARSRARSRRGTPPPRSARRRLLGGGPGWYALATAVAATRVYVRLHHASDVVAGAAFGLALGARSGASSADGRLALDAPVQGMMGSWSRLAARPQPPTPSGRSRGPSVRSELRLPLPLRPQRPRVGRRRACARAATGTCASCRSRSTRCTSKRASRRCGSATPTHGAPACSRCCWGIAVRDSFADHFLDWHVAAFAARHDEGRKIAKAEVLAEIATSVGLDADAVAAEVASGRPAEGARRGAHRGRQALARVRRPDLHRRRARRVRPLHGPRQRRRRRPGARPPRVDRPQRVQAHQRSPLSQRPTPSAARGPPERLSLAPVRMSDTEAIMWAVEKDPALRSDFCNLTILEHVARPTIACGTRCARALAAIPRLGQRVVGAPLRIVPPEFADDPTLDLDAHVRRVALPGAAATTARCSTSAARSPSNRSTGRGRCGSSRSSTASPTGAPRCCRRSTTRSPTASAGCSSRSRSSTSSPTRRADRADRRSPTLDAIARSRHAAARDAHRGGRRRDAQRRRWRAAIDRRRGTRARPIPRELPGPRRRHRPPAPLAPAPGARHRAGPLRRDARPLAHAGTSRSTRSRSPTRAGRGPQARRQRQRRVRHRPRRRARPLPRAARAAPSTSCASRCRSAPATAATTPPTASCRHASSCRSNPPTILRTLFGDVHERLAAREGRDRDRRGRRARRCCSPACPTSLLVAMTRAQTRTIDFAATEPARQPGAALHRRRAHPRELPVRPAHRHRAQRDGAQLLRRPAHRAQHRPGRDHRRRRVHARRRRRRSTRSSRFA